MQSTRLGNIFIGGVQDILLGAHVVHSFVDEVDEDLDVLIDLAKSDLRHLSFLFEPFELLLEAQFDKLHVLLHLSTLHGQGRDARVKEIQLVVDSVDFLQEEEILNLVVSFLPIVIHNVLKLDVGSLHGEDVVQDFAQNDLQSHQFKTNRLEFVCAEHFFGFFVQLELGSSLQDWL